MVNAAKAEKWSLLYFIKCLCVLLDVKVFITDRKQSLLEFQPITPSTRGIMPPCSTCSGGKTIYLRQG